MLKGVRDSPETKSGTDRQREGALLYAVTLLGYINKVELKTPWEEIHTSEWLNKHSK